jgi:hypothetical protein
MGRVVVLRNTHSLAGAEKYAWHGSAWSLGMFLRVHASLLFQGRQSYWVSIFILDSAPAVNASGQNHDFNGQQLLI